MTTFSITRIETVYDGIRLTRDEVIKLLTTDEADSADKLAQLDDTALWEALQTAFEQGDEVWETVYDLLETTGWSRVKDSNIDIELERS